MDDMNSGMPAGDMGGEKKMCSCGQAMDAEGHADMVAADPAAHHEAAGNDMPAAGGDMPEEPAA